MFKDPSPTSDIVIVDFGIANILRDGDELLKTMVGSPGYTSPEVILKTGHGKPSDLWSVGVIAYTLLCGYHPFYYCEDLPSLIEAITHADYEFEDKYWSRISESAKDFVSSMLLLDPSKRITAAAAKLHPWLVANCIHANENVRRMRSVIKNAIERQRRLEEMGLGRDDEEDSELETRDKHPSSASSSAAYVFDARLRRASVISTTGNSTFSSSNPGLSSTSSSSASSYNPSSSSPLRKSSSIFNTSNPNSLIYNNPRSVKDIQDALARLDVSSERRRSMVVVAAQQQLETLPESSSASSTHILLDVNTCIPSAPVAAAAAAAMANTNSDHISPLVSSPIIQKRGSIENLAPCWNYNQRTRHLSFKTAVGAVKAANRFSTT